MQKQNRLFAINRGGCAANRGPWLQARWGIMRHFRRALSLVLLLAAAGGAQENTGAILGMVQDPSGAAVAGVQVLVTNEGTGLARAATTGADGFYNVLLLPVGRYSIQAEMAGFQRFLRQGVSLDVNQKLRVDITLQIGSVEQSVVVSGEAPQVERASSTLGIVVDERKVVDLPLNGRNFTQLGTLLPGTVPAPARLSGGAGTPATTGYSVSGQRTQSNNFLLDGATNNDTLNSGYVLAPPPDAIQEFKILTHSYTAEYGRNSGSVVNVVSRSGTNSLHGRTWEFLRNDKLDARNFFARGAKPPLKQNQFGASLGGPARRDRSFFFGYYEGFRNREGVTQNVAVLTERERRGDFSQSAVKARDPGTRQPYPNDQLPASALSPIATRLLEKLVPLPNSPANRFVRSPARRDSSDQFGLRLDHKVTAANSLFGRYSFSDGDSFNPLGGSNFSPAGSRSLFRYQNLLLADTHVFSPRTIHEASIVFHRQRNNPATWSGLKAADFGYQFPGTEGSATGLPFVSLTGLFSLGDTQQNFTKLARNTYQALDNFTYVAGKHSWKMGFDYRREQIFLVFPNRPNGDLTFSGTFTGNAAADFLLGRVDQFRQGGGDPSKHFFGTQWGFYGQDDFRVTPRFTLNAGVRYELPIPYYDKYNRVGSFQPGRKSTVRPNAPANLLYPGDAGLPRSTIQTDRNNLAPRLGLAWDPTGSGKNSLRAGYGVFFDAVPGVAAFQNINVPPWNRFVQLGNVAMANPYAGLPANPQTDPRLEFPCPCLVIGFSPDFRTPYSQHFSLTFQRQLLPDYLLEAGYVGSLATKAAGYIEINPAIPGPGATLANDPQRRIYKDYNLVRPTFSMFNSNYHSLQTSLNKRFSHGYSFLASYTWSKAIDFQSSVNLGDPRPQDAFRLRDVRGLALYDARHRFVFSHLWELPFFARTPGVAAKLLGGWQVSGIAAFQSGNPFTVTEPTDLSLRGLRADRPDAVSNPNRGAKAVEQWFNTRAFVRLTPAPGGQRSGTAGRNIVIAPGINNIDFAVFKRFRMTERHTLQFRAEAFNLANHPNFNEPGSSIGTPQTFGVISTARPARIIQFGLKYLF